MLCRLMSVFCRPKGEVLMSDKWRKEALRGERQCEEGNRIMAVRRRCLVGGARGYRKR